MKSSHHSVLAGTLLVLVSLSSGCFDANIDFHLCGDLEVPTQIDAVRLLVLDQEMNETHSAVRDLEAEGATLPTTSSLPSGSGPGWVKVQGLLDGVAVIVFARRIGDLDATPGADIVLTEDCLGLDCPVGQTCVAGTCILAPVGTEAPTC